MRGTCRPRSSRHSASRSASSTRSGWSRPRSAARPRRGGPAGGAADDRPRFRRPASAAGRRIARPDRGQDPRVPRDDAARSAGRSRCTTRSRSAGATAAGSRRRATSSPTCAAPWPAGPPGWCLHNGSSRGAPEERPRRSFDLHDPAPVRPARRGGTGGRRPGRGGDASGAASEGSRVPAPFRLARPALGPRPGGLRPHRPGGPGPRRRPRLRLRRPHPAARAALLVRVPRARRLGPA